MIWELPKSPQASHLRVQINLEGERRESDTTKLLQCTSYNPATPAERRSMGVVVL